MLTKEDIIIDWDVGCLFQFDSAISFCLIPTYGLEVKAEDCFNINLYDGNHDDVYFDFYIDIDSNGEFEELLVTYFDGWQITKSDIMELTPEEKKIVIDEVRRICKRQGEDLDELLKERMHCGT